MLGCIPTPRSAHSHLCTVPMWCHQSRDGGSGLCTGTGRCWELALRPPAAPAWAVSVLQARGRVVPTPKQGETGTQRLSQRVLPPGTSGCGGTARSIPTELCVPAPAWSGSEGLPLSSGSGRRCSCPPLSRGPACITRPSCILFGADFGVHSMGSPPACAISEHPALPHPLAPLGERVQPLSLLWFGSEDALGVGLCSTQHPACLSFPPGRSPAPGPAEPAGKLGCTVPESSKNYE